MRFHDPGDKAQSESQALLRMVAIDPIEALEDVREMFGRYADTAVGNNQFDTIVFVRNGDRNRSARLGVFNRVCEQIGDEPFQLRLVAAHHRARFKRPCQRDILVGGANRKLLGQIGCDLA